MAFRAPFRHEAVFYDGLHGLEEWVIPFISREIASGAVVLVLAEPGHVSTVRNVLGPDSTSLRFEDARSLGTNPARLLPVWTAFVREARDSDRPLVGVGALRFNRTPAERVESELHEAVLNVAFAQGAPWRLVCPYDLSSDGAAAGEARRTHPSLIEGGDVVPSPTYQGIEAAALTMGEPLPKAPAEAIDLPFERADLAAVRGALRARLQGSRLPESRVSDLILAANEAATNCIRHGGGAGSIRVWREDARLICEVAGNGLITDPLVGRRVPDPRRGSGQGLWIVNQVCDLVQLRSGPEGTVVRMHMSLAA